LDYFLNPGPRGHDANSGTHPTRPRKTLNGLTLKPKDRVFLVMGGVFDPLVIPADEIQIRPYDTGTDTEQLPTIKAPAAGVGLWLKGKDCLIEDIAISGDPRVGSTCILIDPLATGNTLTRPIIDNFGHGVLNYGSHH